MALKNFPIDFVRQVIIQTLAEEKLKDNKYFGGDSQVNLFSFYEQLQKDEEVNRYVEIYRDLTEQQNRTGLIMNGTIIAPENPTITNLNQCLIIPMSFTCNFRVKLADRDMALETINNLIKVLKGRKQDIAEYENGQLFKVGTIGNKYSDGSQGSEWITAEDGDLLGEWDEDFNLNIYMVDTIIPDLESKNISISPNGWYYLLLTESDGIIVVKKVNGVWTRIDDDGTYHDIVFPPIVGSYDKYKLSMSFDSLRCDEPRNLNSEEYCVISFGGSATLVSSKVMLGNDLVKVKVKRKLIKGNPDITINDNQTWLEPLELPSGNNADTQVNQLLSNKFITNTHTDSLTISLQYTFILDKSIDIIKNWFDYARYGKQANGSTIPYTSGITPNMIYEITEIWSSWGEVEVETFKAKVVESIDIENTESDTLTITIPFQVQGDNN